MHYSGVPCRAVQCAICQRHNSILILIQIILSNKEEDWSSSGLVVAAAVAAGICKFVVDNLVVYCSQSSIEKGREERKGRNVNADAATV